MIFKSMQKKEINEAILLQCSQSQFNIVGIMYCNTRQQNKKYQKKHKSQFNIFEMLYDN
jgi:hypothetical protein